MLWGCSSCSFLVLSIPCMNTSSQPVRVFFHIAREGFDVYSQLLQLVGTELLAYPGSEDVLVPVVELYYHLADAVGVHLANLQDARPPVPVVLFQPWIPFYRLRPATHQPSGASVAA